MTVPEETKTDRGEGSRFLGRSVSTPQVTLSRVYGKSGPGPWKVVVWEVRESNDNHDFV